MLFVSFLLQSVSLIALMVTVFFIERIQQLVGRPAGSYKLLAAIFGLVVNALCLIAGNDGQFNSHWGWWVIGTHLLASGFLLVATFELRNYARVRALSRLNTQTPAPKPAVDAPPAPSAAASAGADAGEPQIVCNSDMEVVEMNQGAARLLGREAREVTGKSITSLVRKEEMLLVPELFRQVKAGEAQGGEWSFRRPDESLIPVRISVRQHVGDQIRLLIQDLTEERAAPKPAAAPASGGNQQLIISLLDASADGYVAFDPDLKIVAWNTRMEKLTGILRDQCLNQHLLMHFPVPEELAEEDYFLESLEGHSNDLANAPIFNPDTNETHIVDHHFAPLFNRTKEIIGGMVIVRKPVPMTGATGDEFEPREPEEEPTPITFAMPGEEADQPPMAEAIVEAPATASAPALLENAFAAAAHIVSVFDLESETETYANRSLAKELGFSETQIEELGEHPLHEIIHPEDQANIPRTAEDWNDGSGITHRVTEFRAIDPDRQWHWFQSADSVLERDAEGAVSKIVSIIRNITRDKEDERRLRLAEQKYRTFSEHCPTGIWHLVPGGRTDYLNPVMCRILGIDSPDEMAERTYHEFITPDSQLNIATQAEPSPGETPTVEIEIQRPDGSLRKCLLHGQAELDEAGQIRNLMGSFVDITDRAGAAAEPAPEPESESEPVVAGVDEITHAALQSELEEALDKLKASESERDGAQADLEALNEHLAQSRATERDLETARDEALALAESSGSRVGELESALEQVREELAEKESVQLNVQTEQEDLRAALTTAQTTLATVEAERDESKRLLAELNSELDEAHTQLETATASLAEAQTARETDAQSLSELKEVKEELELTQSFLEAAGSEQEQAKQALEQAQAEQESAKSALAEAEKSRDEARQALEQAQAELESVQSDRAAAEKSRDEANHYLGETRAELESVKSALAAAEKTRDEALESLDQARAETESAQSKLSAAEQALAEAKNENEQSLALLGEAEGERDRATQALNDTLAELDRLKSELNDEQATREEADNALADARSELKQAQAAAAKLNTELATVKEALAETETVHLEVKSFQDETVAELTAVQTALAAAEASRDENAAELKQTRTLLAQAETARDQADKSLTKTKSELKQSKTIAKEVQSQLKQTNQELDQAKAELARTQAQSGEGVKALENANSSKSDLAKQLNQLQARLDEARAEGEQAKTLRDELESKLSETNRELEHTKSQLDEAVAKLAEATRSLEFAQDSSDLEALQAEIEATKSALAAAESAREENDAKFAESRTELAAVRAKLSDSESSLNESETALELAEAAITELESKHKDAKDALFETNRKWREQEDIVTEAERKFANLQYLLTGIAYRQKSDEARPVEFISVGCAAFTGHAPEQFTSGSKSLLALIHPDDREQVVKAMNDAAKAGQGYQVDYRLMHEDGSERRVSDRGCGVFNAKKELLAFEGVITEVVERRSGGDLAETALHTLPAGIWVTNAEGRTTYHNATWTDITGFESGNGLDWSEAVHGEDRARVMRAFKDAAARHEACEEIFRVRQRDGQFCWMRLIATPRLDARERFTGYLGTCFDITEEVHTAEELKAGQRQMEWAQTRAKLGSWEYHPASKLRRWSRQTSLIYNRRPDDEPPAGVEEYLQLIHEDDRAKITATNDSVMKTGRPVGNLEFRTNPEQGPQRHLVATVYRVPEEDGSAYYLSGTVMDVSDQKAAEENARRSEARYRKIIEVAEEGVWMMDAEGYTSFLNPRMMQMLGYRYREFIGRHFFEFLASESTKEAEEYMERRQQGISEQAEFVFLRKDGKAVNVLINSSSLKDADGDFIGILSLVSDITARKAAGAAKDREQQQIRTVLATAPDFIFSLDERKIVRFVNREYAGMKPDQIVGTPALNWVTPDYRERYDEALQAAFEKGEAQEFEMEGLGPDNTTATYHTRIRPVTENDRITALLVVNQDVTGRPAAASATPAPAAPTDDRLKAFSRRLLSSQEDEFRSLASLLHDEFGQSLSATKLTLQSLAQAEQDAKNKERIEGSLQSLEKLIVRTRELSHDLRSPVLDDLGLFPALRGIVTAKADSTGIALDFQAEEIERLDPEVETTAFRVVEEALANIVQHAGAKAATVAMQKDGDELRLKIADEGSGFDLKKARVGATFGLLRMEERVALTGGAIDIRSQKNKGTTIEVSLPLAATTAPAKAKAKRKRKAAKTKKSK